ncbi:MAG: site-2 protease family protein [Endomicrobium sp.]|jgi:Zn-dependent protease|nr:site-2 protease family protein [Endomicrobium sp.]
MTVFVYIVILLFSAIIHEVAHGYVAYLRGDDTAKMARRITLNPIPHIELFGTILLPTILFLLKVPVLLGWAKPVPLNYKNLKNPRKDIPLVCLAGPASNILLAFLSGLGMHIVKYFPNFELMHNRLIEHSLYMMIVINIILAVINLIPVPPFDGSKIIIYFLPEKIAARYLNLNPYICLMLLCVILSSEIVWKFIYSIANFFVATSRMIAF